MRAPAGRRARMVPILAYRALCGAKRVHRHWMMFALLAPTAPKQPTIMPPPLLASKWLRSVRILAKPAMCGARRTRAIMCASLVPFEHKLRMTMPRRLRASCSNTDRTPANRVSFGAKHFRAITCASRPLCARKLRATTRQRRATPSINPRTSAEEETLRRLDPSLRSGQAFARFVIQSVPILSSRL